MALLTERQQQWQSNKSQSAFISVNPNRIKKKVSSVTKRGTFPGGQRAKLNCLDSFAIRNEFENVSQQFATCRHWIRGVFISISWWSPPAAVQLGKLHRPAQLIDAKIQLRATTKSQRQFNLCITSSINVALSD